MGSQVRADLDAKAAQQQTLLLLLTINITDWWAAHWATLPIKQRLLQEQGGSLKCGTHDRAELTRR